MIELSSPMISSQEDIVDFRNKLYILFQELGLNDIRSVNVTTKLSDLIQNIYAKENSFQIKLGFKEGQPPLLALNFISSVVIDPQLKMEHLKSYVKKNNSDNHEEIEILFAIDNANFNLEKKNIDRLKEKLIIESKESLTRQIKRKNEELKNLLEELKKSSSLIQSEKMRALGVLTAGVAHELNNPMMGILNFIQYCLKKTELTDKRYEALKDAEHETKRCIDIVSNLLTFSHLEKEGKEEFQSVSIGTLITRVIKILSYRLRNEQIEVDETIPKDIPSIMGHENRLQQVILNLVTNALDAMKTSTTKKLGLKVDVYDDHIKVNISDSGEGMTEDVKRKIFEPFFTTKPTGSGTGLGLSVCESIVKEHSGKILCQSELKKGTTFSIILPIK